MQRARAASVAVVLAVVALQIPQALGAVQVRGQGAGTVLQPRVQLGILAVDNNGVTLGAPARRIAGEVLSDARSHNVAALAALLRAGGATVFLVRQQNQLLARPGTFQQIIGVLTKTHPTPLDGETWPGFTLTQGASRFDPSDERAMGITTATAYGGIRVLVGFSTPGYKWGFGGFLTTTATSPAWEWAAGNRSPVRFSSFFYTGDGTGELKNMHWSKWTVAGAIGTGLDEVNNCNPDCAQGHFTGFTVQVVFSKPLTVSCGIFFTEAIFYFTGPVAAGTPTINGRKGVRYVTQFTSASQLCS